jgi:iron uptake system component EfeO
MSGKGIRGAFRVTGEAKPLTEDAKLAAATENYQRYVKSQTEVLLVKTKEFVDAVKAADLDKAKALYPVARTYWERIEPVAEIFGDLDPLIDGREADLEPGTEFTGFHKIEKDLWVSNDVSQSGPIADKLLADVQKIVDLSNNEKLSPLQLANGAKELLDEVASGKITGEEDIFSHTDLWDFRANLEGSKAAVAALRPVLDDRDPALAKTLDEKFAAAEATLDKHRKGDGWRLHNELSESELKELADSINALSEPISKVAAVVAQK